MDDIVRPRQLGADLASSAHRDERPHLSGVKQTTFKLLHPLLPPPPPRSFLPRAIDTTRGFSRRHHLQTQFPNLDTPFSFIPVPILCFGQKALYSLCASVDSFFFPPRLDPVVRPFSSQRHVSSEWGNQSRKEKKRRKKKKKIREQSAVAR